MPRGEIYIFRMALFTAHLGDHDGAFCSPSSQECVAKVQEISQGFQEDQGRTNQVIIFSSAVQCLKHEELALEI